KRDRRALPREEPGRCRADPRSRAGDQGYLAAESIRHVDTSIIRTRGVYRSHAFAVIRSDGSPRASAARRSGTSPLERGAEPALESVVVKVDAKRVRGSLRVGLPTAGDQVEQEAQRSFVARGGEPENDGVPHVGSFLARKMTAEDADGIRSAS